MAWGRQGRYFAAECAEAYECSEESIINNLADELATGCSLGGAAD